MTKKLTGVLPGDHDGDMRAAKSALDQAFKDYTFAKTGSTEESKRLRDVYKHAVDLFQATFRLMAYRDQLGPVLASLPRHR